MWRWIVNYHRYIILYWSNLMLEWRYLILLHRVCHLVNNSTFISCLIRCPSCKLCRFFSSSANFVLFSSSAASSIECVGRKICLDAHRIYLINITIYVSDYCILAAQVPVRFVFCNTNCSNFRIKEKQDHLHYIIFIPSLLFYIIILYALLEAKVMLQVRYPSNRSTCSLFYLKFQ